MTKKERYKKLRFIEYTIFNFIDKSNVQNLWSVGEIIDLSENILDMLDDSEEKCKKTKKGDK